MVEGRPAPRGFGVSVAYTGTRTFVINYRIGARERRLALGRHPDMNVIQAARAARTVRQRIDRGEDPLAEKVHTNEPEALLEADLTVGTVIEDYWHISPSGPGRRGRIGSTREGCVSSCCRSSGLCRSPG